MFVATCLPPFPLEQGTQGGLFLFIAMYKVPYTKNTVLKKITPGSISPLNKNREFADTSEYDSV